MWQERLAFPERADKGERILSALLAFTLTSVLIVHGKERHKSLNENGVEPAKSAFVMRKKYLNYSLNIGQFKMVG